MGTSVLYLILQLAGCVATLLWGTHMVGSGVMRVFGSHLRQAIGQVMSRPWKAFLTGIGVTLGLQSSTAVGLMASSFVARGVLDALPGYWLMLGANIGTALVAQLLSLPIGALTPALLLFGWVAFRSSDSVRRRNIGRIGIGLGFMLLGLHQMLDLSSNTLAGIDWSSVSALLSAQPGLILVGAIVLAWVCHSSVAVVLLALSVVTAGVFPVALGWYAVLGANLGGALPPVLVASNDDERRLPLANLLVRSFGVALGVALAHPIGVFMGQFQGAHVLVMSHLSFNIALAFVAFPFGRQVVGLVARIIPHRPSQSDPAVPLHLPSADDPLLLVSQSEREVLRIADLVGEILEALPSAVVDGDPDAGQRIAILSDGSTALGHAIRDHIFRHSDLHLTDPERVRLDAISVFTVNMEHIADIADHQVVRPSMKRHRELGRFSEPQEDAIRGVMADLIRCHRLSVSVLLSGDRRAAQELIDAKTRARRAESSWQRKREVSRKWGMDLDEDLRVMREVRRIYGHLASPAYAVLS